jgi:hypothetical protein
MQIAIEYYANVDEKKSQHFQRKLNCLLTNPLTIDLIERKKPQGKSIPFSPNLSQNLQQ